MEPSSEGRDIEEDSKHHSNESLSKKDWKAT